MRRALLGLSIVAVVAVAVLAAAIAFGKGTPPPPLVSVYDPFRTVDFTDMPPLQPVAMRGRPPLAVRIWPAAGSDRVVIVIHGSSAHSQSLHPLAKMLVAKGFTVVAPDLRGHGGSGRHGDIDYARELDDDFADLVAFVRATYPNASLDLIGFSSGGGFALREAALPAGAAFERAVLLSPMLGPRAPTVKGGIGKWVTVYWPRLVGLTILDTLGIDRLDGLPVLAFAIAPGNPGRLTAFYSYRLLKAFGTQDYVADLRAAKPKLSVLVGDKDELFDVAQFAPAVHAARPDIPVAVLPGLNHIEMTTSPQAVTAIVAALKRDR